MGLRFSKYEGLGNDFVVVDAAEEITPDEAIRICDRNLGVGADGVLSVGADPASMTVLNADGSVAEMCGNGLRCVVWHLVRTGVLPMGETVDLTTDAGPHRGQVLQLYDGASKDNDDATAWVEIAMRPATLEAEAIPCKRALRDDNLLGLHWTTVGMGNPHAVTFDPIETDARLALGPQLQTDPMFPAGVNVGFAQMAAGHIDLNVLERGAGWTRACGTGACAAAVAAVETGRAERGTDLTIRLPGGALTVRVDAPGAPIVMRGPARHVFDGTYVRASRESTGSP